MKKYKETEKGFYGCYWPCTSNDSDKAIIAMLGDDCEDYMTRSCVKWFHKKFGINVLTLSPAHKDYGHHNLPVERIGAAIEYLKSKENKRFAIAGASTTGMYALIASSYYPEISLTIAMTPSDFVMEGFYRGKKDGCEEWPGEGESTASWNGEPLPYLPFVYRHPEYYRKMKADAKINHDLIVSRGVFDDSEKAHPIREEEFIKVERIKGKLLLIGAEDDVLWDTVKYIKRMEERLSRIPNECEVESLIYEHATHFVFPESLLKQMLPIGGSLFVGLFKAGRDYKKECKAARIDIDKRMSDSIFHWINNG